MNQDYRTAAMREKEVCAQIRIDPKTPDEWFRANRTRWAATRRLADAGRISFNGSWRVVDDEPEKPSMWQVIGRFWQGWTI